MVFSFTALLISDRAAFNRRNPNKKFRGSFDETRKLNSIFVFVTRWIRMMSILNEQSSFAVEVTLCVPDNADGSVRWETTGALLVLPVRWISVSSILTPRWKSFPTESTKSYFVAEHRRTVVIRVVGLSRLRMFPYLIRTISTRKHRRRNLNRRQSFSVKYFVVTTRTPSVNITRWILSPHKFIV